MPALARYVVLVEWYDCGTYDADEIVVWAHGRCEAEGQARQHWWRTKGAVWPSCRVRRVRAIQKNRRMLIEVD